jgi:hypothetical protein
MNILQGIGAVLGGYILQALLTIITVNGLGALFPQSYLPENTAWVIFNVFYGMLFAALGGYAAAWIAPGRPLRHAAILGGLMALFAGSTWGASLANPEAAAAYPQPGWYWPTLTLAAFPATFAGGWLRVRGQSPSPTDSAAGNAAL